MRERGRLAWRVEVVVPPAGDGVTEVVVLEWRVREGERVARGQVLVVVESDKVTLEVPAPADGTVQELGAAVGGVVRVGAVLCVMATTESLPGG